MSRTLYHGGPVLTVNENDQMVAAVVTEGDRIVDIGDLERLQKVAGPDAEIRDLGGRTLVPGFIDPHGHFPDSGFLALHRADLSGPPIGACKSLNDVFARLSEKAAETPVGDWVIGAMFEPSGLAENRFPTREELDHISTDHPIWVIHISGHAGVANSPALVVRGIDDDSPDPSGGRFGRNPETGKLDGLLEGMAAMGALGDTEFQMTYDRFRTAFAYSEKEYLSQGVTMAQNAWATKDFLGHFTRYAKEEAPDLDVMVLPAGFLEPRLSNGELGYDVERRRPILFGPRKLFGDGSFHLQTACLTQPYYKALNGDPSHRCELSVTVEQMTKRIGKLHDMGFQCHIHANGDATGDVMIDAIETVLKANPRADHRHTLIHAQTLREDQLDRMAALGITVSFFPAHLYYWGEFHRDVSLGPERVKNMCPTRWAADRGIRFTIHNDAQVTPTLPLHLMWCATERVTANGATIGEAQRLTPTEALRAHTIDAAWQVFEDHQRGSLEPGKLADFAILSDNPLTGSTPIKDIQVEETIRGGVSVYRK